MADILTPEQRLAVTDRGGRLLVSAAAGSGKTKVLVERLMGYLMDEENPANIDDFLMITYTKAAAAELRGKIAARLTEAVAEQPENRHLQRQTQRLFLAKISTVHGFCAEILREYAYRLDLPADFRVADESECRELRESVLTDVLDSAYLSAGEDADFCALVDTQGLGRDDRLIAEIVLKVYDSARCHLDAFAWLQECVSPDTGCLTDAGQTIWGRYLMQDLFDCLDGQIAVLERCAAAAERSDGMEKAAANLQATVSRLRVLRACANWDEIAAQRNIDYGRLTFPRKHVDAELAEQIKACRAACKRILEKKLRSFADDSRQLIQDLTDSAASARGLAALVERFSKEYERAKRRRHCVDFADLEHKTLDLLLGVHRDAPTAAAAEIGRRFREILVDEYQDSNAVQDAIFAALTAQRQNCFLVGDVKQSIYQFRLADPGIFLEKYRTFAMAGEAKPGQGRKILLSANFRSGGEILAAVNDVFSDCMRARTGGLDYGEAEMLREGVPHSRLPDAAVEFYGICVREDTYVEEAAFAAMRIRQLLDSGAQIRDGVGFRPVREEDIVILLRSPGSVGAAFQRALEAQGVRCTSGGGTDLLRTEEIVTLRSILQAVANPRQDIPLLAALASPVFGFTANDLAALRSRQKDGCIYDALCADASPKTTAFLEILTQLRVQARIGTVAQLIERVFSLTGMDSLYGAMEEGAVRLENLHTFYRAAAEYEAVSRRELGQFLEYLDTLDESGLPTAGEATASGSVAIMSIHKSKGLEFPVVFLCGLSREFNRESLRAQVLCDRELGLGLSAVDAEERVRYPTVARRAIAAKAASESLSEEMRVLYVAMTRAKDRLIMTYAARNLQADLQNLALREPYSDVEILTSDAACPGDWVLLSALHRAEAGELHALGGKPARTRVSDYPWHIRVTEAPEEAQEASALADEPAPLPPGTAERIRAALDFTYAHAAATAAPSKQTATQQKGRVKDREASEQTAEPRHVLREWRAPAMRGGTRGKTYGSAMHAAMQYIRYEACTDSDSVRAEVARLVERRLLTPEQREMVNCSAIARFFSTPVGTKLRLGADCLREFKFSILDDAQNYGSDLAGEQVLLQGVVDCALMDDDGITILDFKTDAVTTETLAATVERYRLQVETYARAMERIYERKVKAKLLYFFRLNRFAEL